MGWIQLAHDTVQLRDSVNTVLNFWAPYGQGIFFNRGGAMNISLTTMRSGVVSNAIVQYMCESEL